jgi:hypothetical protein
MAKKKRSGRQRDIDTATAEALVRYGPQKSELLGLIGDLKGQYKSDVTGIKAQTGAQIAGIRRSRPVARKAFNTALHQADIAHRDVDAAFGALGTAADPFEAATAREFGLNRARTASGRAQALSDLTQEAISARAGKQYGLYRAKAEYRSDLSKLRDRLSDLGDQEGAYIVGRLGDLSDKRASRRLQSKLQDKAQKGRLELEDIKHQHKLDEDKAKAKAQGTKPASRSEFRNFRTDFSKALRYARRYATENHPRSVAADELITGTKSGVPAIDDQLALSIALDMAYDGHVSKTNTRRLHQVGIKVADLPGALSLKAWRKRNKPSSTPILGDLIGTVLP